MIHLVNKLFSKKLLKIYALFYQWDNTLYHKHGRYIKIKFNDLIQDSLIVISLQCSQKMVLIEMRTF